MSAPCSRETAASSLTMKELQKLTAMVDNIVSKI
jgi:hypothetical protein